MRAVSLITIFFLAASLAFAQKPKVYVFLPSNIRPHAMERTLGEAFPALSISVFGRQRQFLKSILAEPPDAIISLAPVVETVEPKVFQVLLRGTKGGRTVLDYALLSASK